MNETDKEFAPNLLFPVPLWTRKVVDHIRINRQLTSLTGELEATMPGVERSNAGGWHSKTDLHLDDRVAEIRQIIGNACVQCASSLGFDFERYQLIFAEMWLNRNGPGAYNKAHIHPNAFLSGAYYVKTPPGSGEIEFYDPVKERAMNPWPLRQAYGQPSQTIIHAVDEGSLVIFPAWLQHGVQANRATEDRISLSFNIIYVPTGAPSQRQQND